MARSLAEITQIQVTSSQYARHKLPGNLRVPPKAAEQRDEAKDEGNQMLSEAANDVTAKEFDFNDPMDIAPKYIYIDNSSRTWLNWTCRMVYNLLKTIHTSVWFYFLPFSVIYLSYIVPYRLSGGDQADVLDPATYPSVL